LSDNILCMEKIVQRHGRVFRGKPASFDPNPRWPKGYFEVLEEAGIPECEHSFFAHWVRQFFNQNPGRSQRSLGAVELNRFLLVLNRDSNMADWQVRQAEDALVLYYEQFRGIALRDVSGAGSLKAFHAEQKKPAQPVSSLRRVESTGSVPAPKEPKAPERRGGYDGFA